MNFVSTMAAFDDAIASAQDVFDGPEAMRADATLEMIHKQASIESEIRGCGVDRARFGRVVRRAIREEAIDARVVDLLAREHRELVRGVLRLEMRRVCGHRLLDVLIVEVLGGEARDGRLEAAGSLAHPALRTGTPAPVRIAMGDHPGSLSGDGGRYLDCHPGTHCQGIPELLVSTE